MIDLFSTAILNLHWAEHKMSTMKDMITLISANELLYNRTQEHNSGDWVFEGQKPRIKQSEPKCRELGCIKLAASETMKKQWSVLTMEI